MSWTRRVEPGKWRVKCKCVIRAYRLLLHPICNLWCTTRPPTGNDNLFGAPHTQMRAACTPIKHCPHQRSCYCDFAIAILFAATAQLRLDCLSIVINRHVNASFCSNGSAYFEYNSHLHFNMHCLKCTHYE